MKKGLVLGLVVSFLFVTGVWAGTSSDVSVTVTITQTLSVSVLPSSYAFGPTTEGTTLQTTGEYFTATNDGNGEEDFGITVDDSTNWTAETTAGADKFVMKYTTDNAVTWNLIDPDTGATLGSNVVASGLKKFGLQLLVPTSTTSGGVQQTIPVTVTAQAS